MGCPGQYRHPFRIGGDIYGYVQRGWQHADRRLATGRGDGKHGWEHIRGGYAKRGGEEIKINLQKPIMTSILWTFQALLAHPFLSVARRNSVVPLQALVEQMP